MSTTNQPPGSAGSVRRMAQLGEISQPSQAMGTPVVDGGQGVTLVPTDAVDPEQAASMVLAAYLEGLVFCVNNRAPLSNPQLPSERFSFERVFDEWPEADRELPYPCATVHAETVDYSAHAMTPTPIEETFGIYDVPGAMSGSVLWKTAELDTIYQVDVWTRDVAKREAIISKMSSAFAPVDGTGRVMLTGAPVYWNLPVRVSLEGIRRVDAADSVYAHERRAVVRVRVGIDVVDLRCASLLDVGYRLTLGPDADVSGDQ